MATLALRQLGWTDTELVPLIHIIYEKGDNVYTYNVQEIDLPLWPCYKLRNLMKNDLGVDPGIPYVIIGGDNNTFIEGSSYLYEKGMLPNRCTTIIPCKIVLP